MQSENSVACSNPVTPHHVTRYERRAAYKPMESCACEGDISASTSSPPPPSMAPLFHVEALLPSSISPKIDSVLHSHVYPQVGHVFRAVARFKALLVDVLVSKKRTPRRAAAAGGYCYRSRPAAAARSGKKRISKMASFVTKLQFAAGASSSSSSAASHHARDPMVDVDHAAACYSYSYYDSAWNVVEEVRACDGDGTAECGYLCWLELEEERSLAAAGGGGGEDDGDCDGDSNAVNEIDRLAENFIARFHAKFLLEKQESYRRYQEMMARSV